MVSDGNLLLAMAGDNSDEEMKSLASDNNEELYIWWIGSDDDDDDSEGKWNLLTSIPPKEWYPPTHTQTCSNDYNRWWLLSVFFKIWFFNQDVKLRLGGCSLPFLCE